MPWRPTGPFWGNNAIPEASNSAMSKTDRIKEEIGWLKVIFAVCVAVDASLIGWLARNYSHAGIVTVVVGIAGVIGLSIAIVYANRVAYRRFRELEDA